MRLPTYLILLFILSACNATAPSSTPPPSKERVHTWARNTVDKLSAESPTHKDFQAYLDNVVISESFDYSQYNLKYDPKSNKDVIIQETDRVFLRNIGVISVLGEYCKLEWNKKNFLPMMQWQRKFVTQSERNGYYIAIVGFTHGFTMGKMDNYIEDNDIHCDDITPTLKDNLFADNFLP